MFLNQGTHILTNSTHAVVNIKDLKTIGNLQIPANRFATIPTKLTGKCIVTTPCILKVETDEIISIQNDHLVMLPMVHLKDEVEPAQVMLTQKFVIWCDTTS